MDSIKISGTMFDIKLHFKIHPLICGLAFVAYSIICFSSCKKNEIKAAIPILTTNQPSDMTDTTIISGGKVVSDGGAKITARGVCWSISQNPTLLDSKTADGSDTGSFLSNVTGLNPNTKYYIRAYASNSEGVAYGNDLSFITTGLVSDIDGNKYHSVSIGTQVWLKENLKVTHYRNGDSIPEVISMASWDMTRSGAYCDYFNLPAYGKYFGRLYNYFTLIDARYICPPGWHIPSSVEWLTLINFLGGTDVAGGKLKFPGSTTDFHDTIMWYDPNTAATNESGFSGLPGGYSRGYISSPGVPTNNTDRFSSLGFFTGWWSSTEYDSFSSNVVGLTNRSAAVSLSRSPKFYGNSIRCIRDY
jgi:uncharacterized protein (TIGR02145 family)